MCNFQITCTKVTETNISLILAYQFVIVFAFIQRPFFVVVCEMIW
jgi:hypothetical protein